MCAGDAPTRQAGDFTLPLCSSVFRIAHSAFRTPHSFPEQGLHLATSRSEYPDGRPWIERLGNAECGVLFADRGDWAMQTGPIMMCRGGMLQHDKQATSRCLCAARYSALRIPHSALRIRSQRQCLHLATSRSEYPDGRPWIERLGNAECGVRNAECCLQIESTGRFRQDR